MATVMVPHPANRPHSTAVDLTRLSDRALYARIDRALEEMDKAQLARDWPRFRRWEDDFLALHVEWDHRDGFKASTVDESDRTTYDAFMGPIAVVGERWIGMPR